MVWVNTQVLELLLLIEHLPTVRAEHLAVGFERDRMKMVQEGFPVG